MVEIPENPISMEDVQVWYRAKLEIKRLQAIENLLRPKIFKHFFPAAKEGTNTSNPLDSTGYVLKGQRIISREVDMGVVDTFRQPGSDGSPSKFQQANINPDNYFKTKLELKVGEYRKLTAEELQVIDQCLVIKDGMPQLDIVPPSTRGQKAGG